MSLKGFVTALLIALSAAAAEAPLPDLRIEPIGGGSVFYVRNTSPQPLTAYLIELVNYPGSSYSLWQDEIAQPIPAGGEKRIQVANMIVGAVPDYVKIQAALYADGTSNGIPEKVTQLIERRRFTLQTSRELIQRLEKALAAGTPKAAVIDGLKQWAGSMTPPGKTNRDSQTAINQAAAKALITTTGNRLETQSLDDILAGLRASERALAASKPAL